MKKIALMILNPASVLIIFSCIAGVALATSVSTTDGKNFNVTDDGGYTTTYTNEQIITKINNFNSQVASLGEQYQQAHEGFVIFSAIEAMAVNANSQLNTAVN